ncbi:MAG: hypothetical protein M1608_05425, partial [Candidatus Omnitrophica bacterium]|nr:hypothetical protein [Candidatus Omnitrophota bacterium]
SALLRVLGTVGGAKALEVVRAAVDNSDTQVHGAAIRVLGAWKSAEVAPALLTLAKESATGDDKLLCLRSYLGWAAHADLPADQRLSMCKNAADLIQRNEEKKLLLGALGGIVSIESLDMITPYLEDAAT